LKLFQSEVIAHWQTARSFSGALWTDGIASAVTGFVVDQRPVRVGNASSPARPADIRHAFDAGEREVALSDRFGDFASERGRRATSAVP
jgi:hypothetical protein